MKKIMFGMVFGLFLMTGVSFADHHEKGMEGKPACCGMATQAQGAEACGMEAGACKDKPCEHECKHKHHGKGCCGEGQGEGACPFEGASEELKAKMKAEKERHHEAMKALREEAKAAMEAQGKGKKKGKKK